ncbi:MAG: ABC transporter permease [Anaerolineaceae bacterium]
MHAFLKLAIVQTKLYLREPMGVFFTLLFGPLMLVMMGFIFGSTPQPILNGLSQLDVSVPTFIALIVGITGLMSIPIGTILRREMGVLRRFSATPLKPITYFLTDILAPFLVTLLGVALLVVMGLLVYQGRFEGNWLNVLAGVCLCTLSFFALGYGLAGLFKSARIYTVLGNVIIIPIAILSGAMVPLEVMPKSIQDISRFDPLAHAVTLLRGLWFGDAWGQHLLEVAVLGGILLLGMLVIALTFKWE